MANQGILIATTTGGQAGLVDGNNVAVLADTDGRLLVTSGGGTGASAQQVQGNVANDAVDPGMPVGIGYTANSGTPSSVATGDRVAAWGSISGAAVIGGVSYTGVDTQANTALTGIPTTNSGTGRPLAVATSYFDAAGTQWVRARGDSTAGFAKAPPLAGIDRSITATTTSQQLMAANTARSKYYIKNDTAIVVWINVGATAVAAAGSGNISIAANGGYYEFTGSNSAINIIAASGTPAITAREF